MGKINLLLIFLVLLLTGCASNIPLTIPEKFDEVVVANFNFSMEELSLPEEEDKGTIDIVTIIRAKQIYDDIKESLKDTRKPPPFKVFLDSIYFSIVDALKNGMNIPIQPLNKYEKDIQHDFNGFPIDNINSVAKKGKFDAVMDISIDITYPSKRTSSHVFGIAKTKVKGKPKLTLKVKMVDKSGKIIWQDRIAVRSNEWVIVDEKWVWGIRYKQDVAGLSVYEMTEQAVGQLVEKNRKF